MQRVVKYTQNSCTQTFHITFVMTCAQLKEAGWCIVQLHLVHWNEDLYDNYEEATRREDGIVIIAVFVTVSSFSILH